MRRLIIISSAAVAATGLAVAPAVAGLSQNPTFSHQLEVRVPSHARVADILDDSTPSAPRSAEPGEDRGRENEPGDDRGATTEPGDDRGATTEPGDDRGGVNSGPGSTNSGPDSGSSGGSGGGSGGGSSGGSGSGSSDDGGHDGGHGSDG